MTPQDRIACVKGAVQVLIDNAWDPSIAFQVCNAVRSDLTEPCFAMSNWYLNAVYAKSEDDLVLYCDQFGGPRQAMCRSNLP